LSLTTNRSGPQRTFGGAKPCQAGVSSQKPEKKKWMPVSQ
jgi:hypothetical protein